MKTFTKNDSGFICENCGASVPPLGVTSRDHCNACLYGLHIDINPGDRANSCRGMLEPVGVSHTSRKGYVIHYRCLSCGAHVNNKAAPDDDFGAILTISKTAR